jgi:N-acyl-D-aspartate/D-glutamate deacylase
MAFETKPLETGVGAEIIGLDLSRPIDEATRSALYEVWLEAGILLFRGIGTSPERQLELSRCFGELEVHPVELMIDLALESDFERCFLQPIANEVPEQVLALMRHPRSVVTFSDAGAHVSQISDCSIPTYLLGHWVREKQALTLEEAIRMLSFENASAFGLTDRGLVREGFVADLVLFDPDRIAPELPRIEYDLPGGARRLVQKAEGIMATVVAGEVLIENGKHSGAFPGRLLRRKWS